MSYAITVVIKDGEASVAHSAAPDGTYTVNGHVPSEGTWQAEHIQVRRAVPDSIGVVIEASGTHYVLQELQFRHVIAVLFLYVHGAAFADGEHDVRVQLECPVDSVSLEFSCQFRC